MLLQNLVSRIVNKDVIIGNIEVEVLDEKILFIKGSYKRVRRWIRGIHPNIGVIIKGLTGWETLIEQDVFIPLFYRTVLEEI